jgi:phage antirepressor YoqD-like protein
MKGDVIMKNELITKEVEFNGDLLMATQDIETGKIYVGVSWICNGIGLSEKQKDNQVSKIQSDYVLKNCCMQLPLKFEGQIRNALSIELDYLPLWLAKISITPTMIRETPQIANKLYNYQLQAQKVLAHAFIHTDNVDINNFQIPKTLSEALLLSANLAKENEEMKPKAEQFDLYLESKGTLSLNQTAKALMTRRNKMMAYLRFKSVFNNDNSPSQYYSDKDYFHVKNYVIIRKSGKKFQVAITTVTASGQDFLYRFLKKNIDEYIKYDKGFKKRLREVSANA